jgi:hypothetical protein
MARNIPTKDNSAAAFTACEFLEAAWWLANNKAKPSQPYQSGRFKRPIISIFILRGTRVFAIWK